MDNYRNMFTLEGKKAVIAGGAGGLGLQISAALMQNGADIAVADMEPAKVAELEKETRDAGRQFLGVRTDILDTASIDEMVDTVIARFGRMDILINAAGMNILKKAEEYDEASWDKVMDLNVKGTHLVTKAVGKHMIAQRYGRIISISSVRSILGMPQDYIAYCASKGAVNMYTKQLACEWAKYGITCNAIAPTFTRTPINAFQLDDPEFYNKLINRIPLGRICTPRDICAAMVYLAGDAAAFVTGQILGVDGGITIIQ
ncbi:gluconate 5-dehydrogenase [Sporobacter termitidis DSM 10068]|uniref:Gluconate 5-dehydrogenase n=1 Tax=Sporobacter termitidis DSM 10068 TaxID=1123282 RepID=A0A1M5YRV3_9FIRM|nr:glucose 1-dehydrogenase [Sporobacter termitidis]SHI14609.1 gluconate 5-dehydrogenase [Sporobacter termitidis DSM 10068]